MAKEVLRVGDVSAAPGEIAYGTVRVGEIIDSSPVLVPLVVCNGASPGPTVWIQNGVHGDEFVGMGAMHDLIAEINPRALRGAAIFVPMANILALRARGRSAPQDGMDMNRCWPGAPLDKVMHVGGHTEYAVHCLFSLLKEHADCVVDCHDGAYDSAMSPYVSYFLGVSPELDEKTKKLAVATGMSIVWETRAEFVAEKLPRSIKAESAKLGIPSVTLEMGGQGRLDDGDVGRMKLALSNILIHLGMLDGKVVLPREQYLVSKGNWLRSPAGGALRLKTRPLDRVKKGQLLGLVNDLYGQERYRVVAPADGIIIGITTIGVINGGEYLGNVGEIDDVIKNA